VGALPDKLNLNGHGRPSISNGALSDFATHYPVGLAGFPRGLLEQITDDDAITVMRCRKTIGWNWV